MILRFEKYQGAGNDFVLLDNRKEEFQFLNPQIISTWCDRHFGIGADGLILMEGGLGTSDFSMRYFNADGLEATMCGNGGRCITVFASTKLPNKNRFDFQAIDGRHESWIEHPGRVHLRMQDTRLSVSQSPYYILDTGSPHFVQFCSDLGNVSVMDEGKRIRYDAAFGTGGVNVNFAEWRESKLCIRTYERGVENETLACGTGSVASAMAWVLERGYEDGAFIIPVKAIGGTLEVRFQKKTEGGQAHFSEVFLIGPAEKVFEGFIRP